jgi:hypothetical protein
LGGEAAQNTPPALIESKLTWRENQPPISFRNVQYVKYTS